MNMCEPKNSAAIYMKQKLTKLKEEIDKYTGILQNFFLSRMLVARGWESGKMEKY